MIRWQVVVLMVAGGSVASSCTHRKPSGGPSQTHQVITRADIERVHARSALDAVQRLRADLLTPRAPSSVLLNKHRYPVVFINDQYLGQVDELRHIPAEGIEEIRIFSGNDAVTKFGAQYGGGIIQVVSRSS